MHRQIKSNPNINSIGKTENFLGFLLLTVVVFFYLATTQMPAAAQEKRLADDVDENATFAAPLSASFNGTDARLTVPHSESLNLTGALTLETWVKPANLVAAQTLIERFGESQALGGYGLRLELNRVVFKICPAQSRCGEVSSKLTLAPNVWQHVAAVYENGEMRIYIGGQTTGRRIARPRPPGAVIGQMRIGANADGTQMYHGLLDEIRISSRAVYGSNFTPAAQLESAANVVALWRFDGGVSTDATTNNNHAVMSGGAGFSPDVPTVPTAAFRITPTPNVGPSNNLYGVKTISPTEVWAVGDHGPAGFCCFPKSPVSLRWNGSQWENVPVPLPPGMTSGSLVAVDATSSTNVWAVGTVGSNSSARVLLLRWNGASWNIVAVVADPVNPQFGIGEVNSITVVSETDVWIVGSRSGGQSWTLRWDGGGVQTVPSPGGRLFDVDQINADDIWAVGSFTVIRWNGTAWLPVPNAPSGAHFSSVAAIAPNDVWATATLTTCGPFSGCSAVDALYHFDGSQWAIVPVPGAGNNAFLEDLSATASDNVWLVGSDSQSKTFVAHFDGTAWRRIASENTAPSDSDIDRLLNVSALNSTEVWTVGFANDFVYNPQGNSETRKTLAQRRLVIP